MWRPNILWGIELKCRQEKQPIEKGINNWSFSQRQLMFWGWRTNGSASGRFYLQNRPLGRFWWAAILRGVHLFFFRLLELLVLFKVRHLQCDPRQFLAQHPAGCMYKIFCWFPRGAWHDVTFRHTFQGNANSQGGRRRLFSHLHYPSDRGFRSFQTKHGGSICLPGGGPGRVHRRHWRKRECCVLYLLVASVRK